MRLLATVFAPLAVTVALVAPAAAASRSGKSFDGANPIGAPRAEFAAAQEGMELVYLRRYDDALLHFEEVGVDFPHSPLGPVGRAIVWQARMWEAGGFEDDRAYRSDVDDARQRRDATRGGDARSWNDFLGAVELALDAMYEIRHDNNLAGLNKAWDAMELVKKVQRAHPDFEDLQLAFGLYNYWRSAYTERVAGLPKWADHKAEGIAQMQVARDRGLLSPAPARLALVYTWLDGKDLNAAVQEAQAIHAQYPGNVLNGVLLGRIQEKLGDRTAARATYEALTEAAPDAWEPWYRLGRELNRDKTMLHKARGAMSVALARASAGYQESRSAYQLAMMERTNRRYDLAVTLLKRAAAADPTWATPRERIASMEAEAAQWAERQEARKRSVLERASVRQAG